MNLQKTRSEAMLHNKKLIKDITDVKDRFIANTPKMLYNPFVSNKAQADYNLGYSRSQSSLDLLKGGSKKYIHPLPSGNDTLLRGPDPKAAFGFINPKGYTGGGFLLNPPPLTGGKHDDTSSESSYSDSDSDNYSDTSSDSDEEGGGIKETLYNVGKKTYENVLKPAYKHVIKPAYEHIVKPVAKEVVIPLAKEYVKHKILSLAGGKKGFLITASKAELIYILSNIHDINNEKIKDLHKLDKKQLKNILVDIIEQHTEPDDHEIIKLIDDYHTMRGGIHAKKKLLLKILQIMYPHVNSEKMTKKDIIKHITGHKKVEEKPEKPTDKGGKMSKHREKSVGHAKNQARGAIIRQLMREKHMTLGEASKYIKDHNIKF